MDTEELHARGLALRRKMFGEKAVAARTEALGEFGAPLQNIINAYVYGDVWSREALGGRERSIAMIAMTAALNRPAELKVHLSGALANGVSAEEIREVLLLVTLYCGIPAGNDAHKAAVEVLQQQANKK
ncbi:MAG TPA: carboxymuconolactone decarboxylase family protein [Burkholderiales bacterium]|jgi:4-carboxymuconolactone decarboxylase|nr:carboxymuconolactone decarboxylase family protein [Burkholderiales bacterium]